MSKLLRQNGDLIVREVEAELFLIDEQGGRIHHLNATASAVWRMLDEPATSKAIIRQFRFLYPEEDAKHLKSAIRDLLRDLADRDILNRMKKQHAN